jgi:NAD+ diphosphatase
LTGTFLGAGHLERDWEKVGIDCAMDNRRQTVHNYYSSGGIDRVSARRRDDRWLADRLEADTTRFIPVWDQKNLFTTRGAGLEPVFLPAGDVRDLLPGAESLTLLGVADGSAYFALGLTTGSPPDGVAARGRFRDLRQVAPLLGERAGALLAYARAMTYWHGRHRFCGSCGSPTRSVEGGMLRVCTNAECGQHHFPRTDPAIIVLVTCGEHCLLGRQPSWPAGMHSTIAGFVEPGESLEDTLVREVREETGVEVKEMTYHSSQPWPFPSSLMLGFTAVAADRSLQVDQNELETAGWFTRADLLGRLQAGTLRLPSPVSVAYRLIEGWFDAGDLGQLRDHLAGQVRA